MCDNFQDKCKCHEIFFIMSMIFKIKFARQSLAWGVMFCPRRHRAASGEREKTYKAYLP